MKTFNISVVFEDGTASVITNRKAEDKTEALLKEINDPWNKNKIICITIVEVKRQEEKTC
jgi:hypothetical protein